MTVLLFTGLCPMVGLSEAFFLGLGDLPGGATDGRARDVADDGSAVVGWGTSFGAFGHEAFHWNAKRGMIGLGDLPGGSVVSQGAGVSGDGRVAVGSSVSDKGPEGFYWSEATGMVGLGDFPGGQYLSSASAASFDGSVIVGTGRPNHAVSEAFRWTAATGLVGLGDLSGGRFLSHASGVSADGRVVVGYSEIVAYANEAFIWTADTGMVGLGDLPGGRFDSHATAVSADGTTVVGGSSSGPEPFYLEEAFRWTADDGMVGLGELDPDNVYQGSRAYDVSGDGSIVVGWSDGAAFIWDEQHGMRNLRDVLINDYGLEEVRAWHLATATGISADGRWITGTGGRGNGGEAWLAHIPEPSTLTLLAAGALAAAGARRRGAA